MASSSATPKSPHQSTYENFESNLQPFYVLHRASSSSNKAEGKSNGTVKTRRRIDLSSPSKPKGAAVKSENDERDEAFYENLRMEAWKFIWTKMESSIKNALTEVNTNVFDEINRWVQKSFTTIRSFGSPSFAEATRSLPIAIDANVKRLFTGLVLTKNIEFVDDLMTFRNLGSHLKSHGCLVANLSSPDFSAKNGISGCLRRFLRQFLASPLDAADMFTFASWYRELGYQDKPVVIIIEDMERCCGHVLSNFILMLSEWVVKVPVILIMGVATTLDAPKNIFSSNALQQLCPCKFSFGSPTERMDAVIETVLVRQFSTLSIGYEVAVFLKNYFLNQDGTLTSFIRALKIACDLHFSTEPLSFILGGLHDDDNKDDKHAFSLEMLLKYASQIHSYQRYQSIQQSDSDLAHCLSELKRSRKSWSFAVLCLYEAGKYSKVRLLDILCEALDPDFHEPMASENPTGLAGAKGGSISQAVRKVRDLPTALLQQLLLSWQKLSIDVPEIRDKVTELLSTLKLEDGKRLNQDLADIPNMHALRSHVSMQDRNSTNEKAFSLIKSLVREYLKPIECIPFHEIVCFKAVEGLRLALIGDTRRGIQVDLLDSNKILKCSCCNRNSTADLLSSMHDSSLMYTLAQERGDLINLHDWFQSFKAALVPKQTPTKAKQKSRQSPSASAKRKPATESENESKASIQARFCCAIKELQISGLLRMPSKRRPDFVQRVSFGL